MMFKKLSAKPIFIIVLVCLSSITLISLAMRKGIFKKQAKIVQKPQNDLNKAEHRVYDKALVAAFDSVLSNFNTKRPTFTIAGTITILDQADTSKKVQDLNFVYCKSGQIFYSRLNKAETINGDGVNIFIDSQTRRIMLSAEKQVNAVDMLNAHGLLDVLASGDYDLKSKKAGSLETISLTNERSFSCREYAITFDTADFKVTHIYTRLCNIQYPQNKDKDRMININLSQCGPTADIDKYPTKNKILYAEGDKWKLTAKYAGFELIQL